MEGASQTSPELTLKNTKRGCGVLYREDGIVEFHVCTKKTLIKICFNDEDS